jgi:rfaE bifunctional protein kinase chain/domain
LRLLRFARECGGRLIVGVASDRLAGSGAHVPEQLRLEGVQSNSWVDRAFLMDEPAAAVIAKLRPDIVVKGKEHEGRKNDEEAVLRAYGGQLIFSSGEVVYSSLDLLRREFEAPVTVASSLPQDYLRRHRITKAKLSKLIRRFADLRVMVVGDLIVDEYIACDPLGMSQEDPTIVVTPIDSKLFVGGAGVVAAHAAGLGAQVGFVSVSGNDPSHYFAKLALAGYGVKATLLVDRNRPTTLKQRFRSKGKTLLRVSHLHQASINTELQSKLLATVKRQIKNCDLLVFSDFNYGCLPRELVEELIKLGQQHKLVMVADSQSSSQVGDVSRFQGMDLLTPTEREARIATRDHESGLVVLAEKLRQQAGARNVLLKLGEEGVMIHSGDPCHPYALTDRIPALNTAPRDVAGAGDSMLIASSMAMACGADIWSAASVGALAAAVQVSRVGNTPLQSSELLQELA